MPELIFANRGAAETIRLQEKLNDEAAELGAIYARDSSEAEKLRRAAKAIYETSRSEQDKLISKVAKIKKAQEEGLIPPAKAKVALKQLQSEMEDLESQSNKTFGEGALGRLATFAGGLAPIGAALAAVTAEFKSQLDLVDRAAQTQISLVPGRQNLIDNLRGQDPKEIARILSESQKIALTSGVSEAFINPALGASVSASGGDLAGSLSAVRFAAKQFADRPEQIEGFAGSLLDISAVTGSKDPKVNAGVIGLLSQQSRLTSARQISVNAPKALVAARGFDASLETAISLFSTISNASKDSTGEVTKTAITNFTKTLDTFGPVANLPNARERIGALQADAALRDQFIKKAGLPGEAIVPIRELLTPGTAVAKSFARNRSAVPGLQGLASLADEGVTNLGLDPLQPVATAKRQIAAINEDLRKNATQNLDEDTRLQLVEILQRVGQSNLSARGKVFFGQLQDSSLGVSVSEAANILEGEANNLTRTTNFYGAAGVGAPGVVRQREATDEEKQNAKALQRVSDVLERSLEVQKETSRKLDNVGVSAGAD